MIFASRRRVITPGELTEKWEKVDDVLGGTPTMRAAGKRYLPKEVDEAQEVYDQKLKLAVLDNHYKNALEAGTGVLSANGVTVMVDGEPLEATEQQEAFLANVDGLGSDLEMYVEEINGDQMNYGIAYVLVDHPQTSGEITLEEQQTGNVRPYLVTINPLSVVEIHTQLVGAVEVLTYFEYEYQTPDDETQLTKTFSIVSPPGSESVSLQWSVYKKQRTPQGVTKVFIDGGTITGVDRLPIVPVYGQKLGPWLGTPVLEDLADLNISHWQKYAQHNSYVKIATGPMIKITGMKTSFNAATGSSESNMKVSPYRIVELEQDGDANWLEISGASIQQSREDLLFLEAKMKAKSAELTLTEANTTATANALKASESVGKLSPIKKQLTSGLAQVFDLVSQYEGANIDYSVVINDNVSNIMNNDTFGRVEKLHDKKIISDETLLDAVNTTLPTKLEINKDKPDEEDNTDAVKPPAPGTNNPNSEE